jgi:hypothetical protein
MSRSGNIRNVVRKRIGSASSAVASGGYREFDPRIILSNRAGLVADLRRH